VACYPAEFTRDWRWGPSSAPSVRADLVWSASLILYGDTGSVALTVGLSLVAIGCGDAGRIDAPLFCGVRERPGRLLGPFVATLVDVSGLVILHDRCHHPEWDPPVEKLKFQIVSC